MIVLTQVMDKRWIVIGVALGIAVGIFIAMLLVSTRSTERDCGVLFYEQTYGIKAPRMCYAV